MLMNQTPTLVLGLGGIGSRVANFVDDMLSEKDRKYVSCLGMDTNIEDLKKLTIKYVQTSDRRRVRTVLEEHPEYCEWFPVNKFTVDRGMLEGAGQIRAISRLAGLEAMHTGKFRVLEDEMRRIMYHDGKNDTSRFNVLLVGSITGGTGAGLFLQIPYYIRNYLKKEMGMENIRIRGMYISADITSKFQPSDINREAVKVNAYACMKELNAFYMAQEDSDATAELSLEFFEHTNAKDKIGSVRNRMKNSAAFDDELGDLFDDIDDTGFDTEARKEDVDALASNPSNIPYDAFYLIEGTDNEGGIGIAGMETIEKHISRIIYTMLFTPVKGAEEGVTDNMVLQDMEGDGMNRYSSAGLCTLRYPYETVRDYVAHRWVSELVQKEWLLIDDKMESEKKEAEQRRKADPTVKMPKASEAYVRIYRSYVGADGTKGGGKTPVLGNLREDAFIENKEDHSNPISKASRLLKDIEAAADELFTTEELKDFEKECQLNENKLQKQNEATWKEFARVYDSIEEYSMALKSAVSLHQYEIANRVFPTTELSLRTSKQDALCLANLLQGVHPVSARFIVYDLYNRVDKLLTTLESTQLRQSDLDQFEKKDFLDGDEDVQNAVEACRLILTKKAPGTKFGTKNAMEDLTGSFRTAVKTQTSSLLEYSKKALKIITMQTLKIRLERLAEYYAEFFQTIHRRMTDNAIITGRLENTFAQPSFGEIAVYASAEAMRQSYAEFSRNLEYTLPDKSKKAIFTEIFKTTLLSLQEDDAVRSKAQKDNWISKIRLRMSSLFEKGIVEKLAEEVEKKGRGTVDLSIKEALEKEFLMETGEIQDDGEYYAERRIQYERTRIEEAMRVAVPMFAVENVADVTETIYLAIHPDAAEEVAGVPDRGATHNALVPEVTAATDYHPVSVLMDEEFSRYEIICMKAKHKYYVQNLIKYGRTSDYAVAYRKRIAALDTIPKVVSDEAYKTVVNPHLSRYWHEEGFLPALTAEERKEEVRNRRWAFILGMGYDTFSKEKLEEVNNRTVWVFRGRRTVAKEMRQKGRLVTPNYASLYDSLRFNRKVVSYMLRYARAVWKQEKEYEETSDLVTRIQDTILIEDLVQPAGDDKKDKKDKQDKNFLDIMLDMRRSMKRTEWDALGRALGEIIMEYLKYMLDGNVYLINQAYQDTIRRMYRYSSGGKKKTEASERRKAGEEVGDDLKLTVDEQRIWDLVKALLEEEFIA